MNSHRTQEDPDRLGGGEPNTDASTPTATAPDSVDESVPTAADAGQEGPDAADPPRAAGKHAAEDPGDPDLAPEEGADAFETQADARAAGRTRDPDPDDEDHVSIDPPD